MRSLVVHRVGVMVMAILLLASAVPYPCGADRATSSLTLDGVVLTGNGDSTVRGVSVTLLVYNSTDALVHTDFAITGEGGNYSFTVPADKWDPGVNTTLRASYTLVGANVDRDFVLGPGSTQQWDVTLPWNRTLGTLVTVVDPSLSSPRDGQVTFVFDVSNDGNDTDAVLLWATPSDAGVVAIFAPTNRTELAPGADQLVSIGVSGPDLPPGDYLVTVGWRSEWYPSEKGSVDVTWTVSPEVDVSISEAGVSWWPDPLFQGDTALLNCTVSNGGRDTATLANVTIELVEASAGIVLRDKVRIDVPADGTAVATFPWTAVYSEEPYVLKFEVEHPLDIDHDDDAVEVQMPTSVDNAAPTVTFTAPENGTHVNGTVSIKLVVFDPDTPVERVRLSIGGGNFNDLPTTPTVTYEWDTTAVVDGWYVLEAYATDQYATGEVVRLELKVENQGPNHPPELLVEAPLPGDTVADVLRVEGITFDQDDHVEKVEVRIDGGDWVLADGSERWSVNVSTAGLSVGTHLLEVMAHDGIDPSEVVPVEFNITDTITTALEITLSVNPPTVLPKERLKLGGEVRYDNGVRAPGLEVWIEGPDSLFVKRVTDVLGRFELSVNAPGSEGVYEFSGSTSDNGMATSNSISFRVLRSLDPDLTVHSITIETEKVAVGVNVTVSVLVRNLGYSAGNGTMRAWAGPIGAGEPVEVRNLTVYDNITVSFTWVPNEEGEVELTVDIVDVIPADANSTNNRRTEVVLVANLPDLIVESIVLSNPSPHDNASVSASVRVANLGSLNASCTVRLYLDNKEVENLLGDLDVAVAAHGFTHATFDLSAPQGPHRLYAEVVNAYPEEANIDNNMGSQRFNVTGPYEPPPSDEENGFLPGPGGGAAVIAMVVASLVVIVVADRRRLR